MKKVLLGFGRAVAGAALVVCLLAPPKAAADFFYLLDNTFSGTSPSSAPPWVDAFFHDVTPGTVDLTVSAVGLAGGEFLSELYININPSDDASLGNLVFTRLSTTGSFTLPTIDKGTDAFKADGDGKYDVRFNFGTANGTTFGGGDSITYKITGIPGLTAMDFDFLSLPAGGSGPFLAAGHIQGIGTGASGWISPTGLTPVPEPSTVVLLGASLGLFGGARHFFGRAKKS